MKIPGPDICCPKNEVAAPAETKPDPTAAQARRDRLRLAAARNEIDELRQRILTLEQSPGYRAGATLARAARFGLRMTTTARSWLLRGEVLAPAGAITAAPTGGPRGRALVIDHNWPTPDRDSGSIDIITMVRSLEALGFEVILAAAKQHEGMQPARDNLSAQGICCLQPEVLSVSEFLIRQGSTLDLVVLCRVYCGGEYLELVQLHCLKARLIFDSIDLCFMRVEREARLLDDAKLLVIAAQIRRREEHLVASCDATIVVSQTELDWLAQNHPHCLAAMLPLARAVHAPVAEFAARQRIGFIGGFAHAPNTDAMRFFLREIWPRIHAMLPDCSFDIVGADAPVDLLDGVAGPVRLLGHVPDIRPWFESLRLSVAPLRYGAGAKGKVASSLAAGVPCIATSVAAEGMRLGPSDGVVVAATPEAFADAVIQAYQDATLWASLSAGGYAYANRTLSPARWQDRLKELLGRIGF